VLGGRGDVFGYAAALSARFHAINSPGPRHLPRGDDRVNLQVLISCTNQIHYCFPAP